MERYLICFAFGKIKIIFKQQKGLKPYAYA